MFLVYYYTIKTNITWDLWLAVLFYGVSTLFVSFKAEISHFDKRFKQFSLVNVPFFC